MEPSFKPVHISFPMPRHPHLNFHAHLSFMGNCTMAHLTTTNIAEDESTVPPMGSLVYAMPDMRNDRNVISTPLATSGSNIDYATRMAKVLARKMKHPVYVGCSMDFTGMTAEEEMEGFAAAVDQIMERWDSKS
ncbi:uncharacterized protein PV07_04528 [Cladophialophora immunda]|uniref:Proteasome assembly chaperone 4 n=1 Tax=Cladophialophora immunda TaxID=569365 RepID=A0A0D2CT08_9EURO|nr:uncharacterized protein PV07_04528 [Cladophialophora immunda]KIW33025.1 hypothetical protein PV07_04528 [Cladophialophora immunda]OQV07043.1 hypothetical protein CLAIMM_11535 [Cladophialophora immunda]